MDKDENNLENRGVSDPLRDAKGRWLPGTGGRPGAGRPLGNRQRIAETLLADLREVWDEHGKTVLTKLAISDPAKLATIAYGLLPRDVFINVQRDAGPMEADEVQVMRGLVGIINTTGAAKQVPSETILSWLEEDLRARLATNVSAPLAEEKKDE
jgi:hypothetical protein